MVNEVQRINQIFKNLTDKVSRVSKQGYNTALLSLEASQKTGKATVLKIEISTRKVKMKKLFTKLGEQVFSRNTDDSIDIFQDARVRELIDALKVYDDEIKEIEQHIESFEISTNIKNLSQNRINETNDVRIVENALTENRGTKGALSDRNVVKDLGLESVDSEIEKSDDMSRVINELKNKDKDVRLTALKQLFRYENSEATPHLINALKDKEEEIRRRASSYLGWKMIVSAAPSLMVTVSKDRSQIVKKAAVEALGELGTKEAVPTLIEALDSGDLGFRKIAYKSLTKITNEFIEFKADGSLSERFKSIQKWEKWWKSQAA